ncbi:MAG: LuxR C-terminal-related transcriptional regulator [Fimbriimonadaceae bacterium]|nr:LuxR C-terminal-related transcriptional regulator [Fimbriimonadaceae bacterium]
MTSKYRAELSKREHEMVRLAASGLTDKEIARHLDISPASVNTYWVRCREKLGVGSRAACVAIVLSSQTELERPSQWELRWTALIEATSQCVMVLDEHHVVRMVNQAFVKLFKTAEADIIGQSLPRGGDTVFDERGRQLAPDELPVSRCYATGMPLNERIRIVRPGEPDLWLQVWVRPLIYSDDLPTEVLAVFEPIAPTGD